MSSKAETMTNEQSRAEREIDLVNYFYFYFFLKFNSFLKFYIFISLLLFFVCEICDL